MKDDFHIFKGSQSKTFFSYFDQMLYLEKKILRYIKFCQKSSFLNTTFSNIQVAKNGHVSKLKMKNLVRKCFSQRRFSHSKLFFIKTILNQSIFQINITRVMFGPKT
jgi:hypothetical protein